MSRSPRCVCGHALSSHHQDPDDPYIHERCRTCGCASFENEDEAKMQNDAEDDGMGLYSGGADRSAAEALSARSLETRALFALWRNHPDTPAGERWGARAHRLARVNRDMLLAWAATMPDYRLLDCRNFGATSLAWVRANQPTGAEVRPFVPISPTSAIRELMSRHADCSGECEIWAERDAILAVQHESAEAGYRAALSSTPTEPETGS